MFIIETGAYLGIATTAFTEIIKFLPYFDTKAKKKWLAFAIALMLTIYAASRELTRFPVEPIEFIGVFGITLSTAYAFYKAIVEHIEDSIIK